MDQKLAQVEGVKNVVRVNDDALVVHFDVKVHTISSIVSKASKFDMTITAYEESDEAEYKMEMVYDPKDQLTDWRVHANKASLEF